MALVLNDDQTLLAETAKNFATERLPLGRIRRLRQDATGFDPALWKQMSELGWTAIPFSEDDGGLGLGLSDLVCVTEALGRGLPTEPYLSNVLLAGGCIAEAGTPAQKESYLGPMLAGERHLALALEERAGRFQPWAVRMCGQRKDVHYRLDGEKVQVLGGNVADTFVVVARTSGAVGDKAGLTLFLVPRDASGVQVVRQWRVDAAPVALLRLNGVELAEGAVLGAVDGAGPVLDSVFDRATVALCGEMLGGMTAALERTIQYLKERTQFGVQIGSFQALQHRAARLFIEVELSRSAVLAAARALDDGEERAAVLVSVAKARTSDAFMLVANEAVQMHGGIGMTDEHDIGFFLKRARGAEMTLGDAAYHRARFAQLSGF